MTAKKFIELMGIMRWWVIPSWRKATGQDLRSECDKIKREASDMIRTRKHCDHLAVLTALFAVICVFGTVATELFLLDVNTYPVAIVSQVAGTAIVAWGFLIGALVLRMRAGQVSEDVYPSRSLSEMLRHLEVLARYPKIMGAENPHELDAASHEALRLLALDIKNPEFLMSSANPGLNKLSRSDLLKCDETQKRLSAEFGRLNLALHDAFLIVKKKGGCSFRD